MQEQQAGSPESAKSEGSREEGGEEIPEPPCCGEQGQFAERAGRGLFGWDIIWLDVFMRPFRRPKRALALQMMGEGR